MRPALLLALLIASAESRASSAGDAVLSGYYLGKASLPFFLLPTAIEDGDMVLLTDLGLFAALTVPAAGVLYHRWVGNPERAALWRKITLGADLAMAAGGAAWGIYWMATPEPDENAYLSRKGAGALLLIASALYGGLSLFDLIPFSTERQAASPLTVQPSFVFHSMETGVRLAYRF